MPRKTRQQFTPEQTQWLVNQRSHFKGSMPWSRLAELPAWAELFHDRPLKAVKQHFYNVVTHKNGSGRLMNAQPATAVAPNPVRYCPCCGTDLQPYMVAGTLSQRR